MPLSAQGTPSSSPSLRADALWSRHDTMKWSSSKGMANYNFPRVIAAQAGVQGRLAVLRVWLRPRSGTSGARLRECPPRTVLRTARSSFISLRRTPNAPALHRGGSPLARCDPGGGRWGVLRSEIKEEARGLPRAGGHSRSRAPHWPAPEPKPEHKSACAPLDPRLRGDDGNCDGNYS